MAAPYAGRVRFIGIDGQGASGKSTLATLLAGSMGIGIVHTDDLASWDNPLDWYPELIARVFVPASLGAATVTSPRRNGGRTGHRPSSPSLSARS